SGTNEFKESSGSVSETKHVQTKEFDPEQEKLNDLLGRLNNLFSLSEEDKKILQEYLQNKEKEKYLIIDTPGIGDTKMSDNEVLDIIAEAVYLGKDGIGQVFFVTNGRFDQYEMATYDLLRTILFDKDITKHTTIVRTHFKNFKNPDKCETDVNLMAKEIKEQELTNTSLSEIIKSCNKVVHVDNPPLDDEEKLEISKNKRAESRKILLEHLDKNCQ